MDILKKPYEVSLWEDVFLPNGEKEEKFVTVIGSNNSSSSINIFKPMFTLETNGVKTLSFSIFYNVEDENTGEFIKNPLVNLLVNERKIKLKYGNEWYDFVIKERKEDSKGKTINYVAKDAHINELSKNGFSLEFENELENNMGTASELARKTLENTDWNVSPTNIKQYKSDYLYKILLKDDIIAENIETGDKSTISAKETIYCFYTDIINKSPIVQFLYRADDEYKIDNERIILNSDKLFVSDVTYTENKPDLAISSELTTIYKGKKLIQTQETMFDAHIEKFVSLYTKDNKTYRAYSESEFLTPSIVTNYLLNSKTFVNNESWVPESALVKQIIYPPLGEVIPENLKSYLQVNFEEGGFVNNLGLKTNLNKINTFTDEEVYVCRYKIYKDVKSGTLDKTIKAKVYLDSELFNTGIIENELVLDFKNPKEVDGYVEMEAKSNFSYSYKDLLAAEDLRFVITGETDVDYYIEDIQFFKKYTIKGKTVYPEVGVVNNNIIYTKYHIYEPPTEKNYTIEDIAFAYKGDVDPLTLGYAPKYKEGFEKVRSIKIKESNRFNILQTIAETFECWLNIHIEHDSKGKVLSRSISFDEEVGVENFTGFKQDINLTSIQKDLVSDEIVSKLIVKNNSNKYATFGFASISLSKENYCLENFILNFDYYIKQGLLDINQITNDLYLETDKYLGYYVKLRRHNLKRDALIERQLGISTEMTRLDSTRQAYGLAEREAKNNALMKKNELKNFTGKNYDEVIVDPKLMEQPEVVSMVNEIITLKQNEENFKHLTDQAKGDYSALEKEIEEIKETLKEAIKEKNIAHLDFYNKYSNYIQEGSWISEDYVNNDLYYLDGESVLYTSSSPKITYRISALELSQLDEYKNYEFKIGDKTYIEDVDFFGYNFINGVRTPYRETIIVNKIEYDLDNPSRNTITVENFKSQFQDLFQKITAQTQALKFSTGDYNKAANTIDEKGFIKPTTLQHSLINNSLIISNAKDQSVVWNDNGLTITNLSKLNEILRIVSGGILLSKDSGDSWETAITGSGINANYITSGQLNASEINIMSGVSNSFRWDGRGINAFGVKYDETNKKPLGYNYSQFTRFDQYGIYGLNSEEDFEPTSLDEVVKKSDFSFTWKGVVIKTDGANSNAITNPFDIINGLSLSKDNDIQVFSERAERVKLGFLGVEKTTENNIEIEKNIYGLRLKNDVGEITLETKSDGNLFVNGIINANGGKIGCMNIAKDSVIIEDGSFTMFHKIKDEDGKVIGENRDLVYTAESGLFISGTINADSGRIGSMNLYEDNTVVRNGQFLIENPFYITETLKDIDVGVPIAKGENISIRTNFGFDIDNNARVKLEFYLNENDENSYFYIDRIVGDKYTYNLISLDINSAVKGEEYYSIPLLSTIKATETVYNEETSEGAIFVTKGATIYIKHKDFPSLLSQMKFQLEFDYKEASYVYEDYPSGVISTTVGRKTNLTAFDIYNLEETADELNYKAILKTTINATKKNTKEIVEIIEGTQILIDKNHTFNLNHQLYYNIDFTFGGEEYSYIDIVDRNIDYNFTLINSKKVNLKDNLLEVSDKNLIIGTDAIFKGALRGVTGDFTGNITANSGTIGGAIIEKDNIKLGDIILDNDSISTRNFSEEGNQGFKLSKDGKIHANEITLGNATIKDKIAISKDSFIQKPTTSEDLIMQVGKNIKLYDNAKMEIGDISFNGINTEIRGKNWNITSNLASFNNVNISGKLNTVAFNKNITSSIGSTLLLSDGIIIENVQNSEDDDTKWYISIKNSFDVKVGDYCGFQVSNFIKDFVFGRIEAITQVGENNQLTFTFSNTQNIYGAKDKILFNFNQAGSETEKEKTILSINGSSNNGSPFVDESISLNKIKFNGNTNLNEIETKIILGKIPNDIKKYGKTANTYGLYADNVLLKGAMVAKGDNFFSGINTENTAEERNTAFFPNKQLGKILLWAGAANDSDEAIENANFRVDSQGNLYAGSGYFNGTIITRSFIESAEIRTAKIIGTGKEKGYGLTIEDMAKGIVFKNLEQNKKFTLGADGIKTNLDMALFDRYHLNEDGFIMPRVIIKEGDEKIKSFITNSNFGFTSAEVSNLYPYTYDKLFDIAYEDNKVVIHKNNLSYISFTSEDIRFERNTRFGNKIYYGEKMEDKPVYDKNGVVVGYDLYIYEEEERN